MKELTGKEIRKLYNDLKEDLIQVNDLDPNEKRYIRGFIRCEIKRLTKIRDIVRESRGNENYDLLNIPEYRCLIRLQTGLENKKKPEVTNKELALIKYYNGEDMGYCKSDLFNKYTHFKHKANRIGPEESDLKNKNKIKLYEKVISQLSGKKKERAEDDFEQFKNNIHYQ